MDTLLAVAQPFGPFLLDATLKASPLLSLARLAAGLICVSRLPHRSAEVTSEGPLSQLRALKARLDIHAPVLLTAAASHMSQLVKRILTQGGRVSPRIGWLAGALS